MSDPRPSPPEGRRKPAIRARCHIRADVPPHAALARISRDLASLGSLPYSAWPGLLRASRRVRWRAAQLLAAPHWTRAFWLLWSIIVRCSAFLGLALNNRTDSAFSCAGASLSSFGVPFHVVGSLVRLEPGCDLACTSYVVQYLGDRSYRDIRCVQVPPVLAQPGPRAPYTKRPSERLYRDLDK